MARHKKSTAQQLPKGRIVKSLSSTQPRSKLNSKWLGWDVLAPLPSDDIGLENSGASKFIRYNFISSHAADNPPYNFAPYSRPDENGSPVLTLKGFMICLAYVKYDTTYGYQGLFEFSPLIEKAISHYKNHHKSPKKADPKAQLPAEFSQVIAQSSNGPITYRDILKNFLEKKYTDEFDRSFKQAEENASKYGPKLRNKFKQITEQHQKCIATIQMLFGNTERVLSDLNVQAKKGGVRKLLSKAISTLSLRFTSLPRSNSFSQLKTPSIRNRSSSSSTLSLEEKTLRAIDDDLNNPIRHSLSEGAQPCNAEEYNLPRPLTSNPTPKTDGNTPDQNSGTILQPTPTRACDTSTPEYLVKCYIKSNKSDTPVVEDEFVKNKEFEVKKRKMPRK